MRVKGRSGMLKVDVRGGWHRDDVAGGHVVAGDVRAEAGGDRCAVRDAGALRERRSGYRPGRVVADVAVMLADGGKCVSDLAALADSRRRSGRWRRCRPRGGCCSRSARPSSIGMRASARAGPSAGVGGGRRARRGDPGLRFDAGDGALREGGRGRALQGRVRVSPAAGELRARGAGRRAAAGQRRCQRRRRPRDGARARARAAAARRAGWPDPRALGLRRRQPRIRRGVPRDPDPLLARLPDRRDRSARRSSPPPRRPGSPRPTATASSATAPG